MDGKILLMDYSKVDREKTKLILGNIGNFDITEIIDYNSFSKYQNSLDSFILLIMDIALPSHLEGFERLHSIRNDLGSQIPIIVATRYNNPEFMYSASKYTIKDFIVKPYALQRLESSIRNQVNVNRKFLYATSGIQNIHMTFEEYVAKQFKLMERFNKPLSIVLIKMIEKNIDKKMNESADPDFRKVIYKTICETSKQVLRTTDGIMLNGSSDLLIFLPGTNTDGAMIVKEKIRNASSARLTKIGLKYNELLYMITVCYPDEGMSFNELIENAFKKLASKEMLENITSISESSRQDASKRYNQFRKWF